VQGDEVVGLLGIIGKFVVDLGDSDLMKLIQSADMQFELFESEIGIFLSILIAEFVRLG
jgi:hypothetical protein